MKVIQHRKRYNPNKSRERERNGQIFLLWIIKILTPYNFFKISIPAKIQL